jgi:protein-S-isoprenylcysteine O-methyltransferase Ste14
VLLLYALVLFVGGLRIYDLQAFLGLRQWRDYRTGHTSAPPAFRKTGILRYVRHPWYSGGIALLWSLPALTDVTLVTRSIISAYLIVGALLEESKLRKSLGEPYLSYCREVPMLLPWKFGR